MCASGAHDGKYCLNFVVSFLTSSSCASLSVK